MEKEYCLSINNFQRFGNLELPLRKGFTCIVGTSNTGKSSILRAVFSVLRNDFAPSYISTGEKTSKVSIKCNGDRIECVTLSKAMSGKTLSGNQYEIAPLSVHPKVGKAPLSDFLPRYEGGDRPPIYYNADPVTIQPSPTSPQTIVDFNYQSQFQGMFLFSMSPSQMSVVFNHLFGASRYQTALRLVNRDVTALNSDSERLTEERRVCSETLSADESELSEVSSRLEELDSYLLTLRGLRENILTVDNYLFALGGIRVRKDSEGRALNKVFIFSKKIKELGSSLGKLHSLTASIESMNRFGVLRKNILPSIDRLRDMNLSPLSDSLGRYQNLLDISELYNKVCRKIGEYKISLDRLREMDSLVRSVDPTKLLFLSRYEVQMSVLNRKLSEMRNTISYLKARDFRGLYDSIKRLFFIDKYTDELRGASLRAYMARNDLDCIIDLQKSLSDYRTSIMEAGGWVCPLCGRSCKNEHKQGTENKQ